VSARAVTDDKDEEILDVSSDFGVATLVLRGVLARATSGNVRPR
jgi:hypothetical protein